MYEIKADSVEAIKKEMARYEDKRSAILPALYIIQRENNGWISQEAIQALSDLMGIPIADIEEVFQFYSMYNKKPVGKYHVQVCGTLSCHINGSTNLLQFLLEGFQVKLGEVTSDGRFSFSRVECLGSCGTAPVMMVNDTYYENLTQEGALKILKDLP